MNPQRTMLVFFFVVLMAVLGRSEVTTGVARVVRLNGPALCLIGTNVWRALKVGDELKAGATIQTGSNSDDYVDLALLADAGPAPSNSSESYTVFTSRVSPDAVRLWNNTRLDIAKLEFL